MHGAVGLGVVHFGRVVGWVGFGESGDKVDWGFGLCVYESGNCDGFWGKWDGKTVVVGSI